MSEKKELNIEETKQVVGGSNENDEMPFPQDKANQMPSDQAVWLGGGGE